MDSLRPISTEDLTALAELDAQTDAQVGQTGRTLVDIVQRLAAPVQDDLVQSDAAINDIRATLEQPTTSTIRTIRRNLQGMHKQLQTPLVRQVQQSQLILADIGARLNRESFPASGPVANPLASSGVIGGMGATARIQGTGLSVPYSQLGTIRSAQSGAPAQPAISIAGIGAVSGMTFAGENNPTGRLPPSPQLAPQAFNPPLAFQQGQQPTNGTAPGTPITTQSSGACDNSTGGVNIQPTWIAWDSTYNDASAPEKHNPSCPPYSAPVGMGWLFFTYTGYEPQAGIFPGYWVLYRPPDLIPIDQQPPIGSPPPPPPPPPPEPPPECPPVICPPCPKAPPCESIDFTALCQCILQAAQTISQTIADCCNAMMRQAAPKKPEEFGDGAEWVLPPQPDPDDMNEVPDEFEPVYRPELPPLQPFTAEPGGAIGGGTASIDALGMRKDPFSQGPPVGGAESGGFNPVMFGD